MNQQQYRKKEAIMQAMMATARRHGKDDSPWHIKSVANRLHRLEVTLSRLAEDQSNYPEYDSAKQERLEKLAENSLQMKSDASVTHSVTQEDSRFACTS